MNRFSPPARITQAGLQALLADLSESGAAPSFRAAHSSIVETGSIDDLPESDLRDRTVLDVGCNLGLRCLQAALGGARRVVGLDANVERIVQARAIAADLGLNIEYVHLDVDTQLPDESFDTVFCFDILHRSVDPAALLQRLALCTRGVLVIESIDFDHPSAGKYLDEPRLPWWMRRLIGNAPVLVVGRNGPNLRSMDSRFLVTRSALGRLLTYHQGRFAKVDLAKAARPGMYRATARRRRVNSLILVAGASGVGKTRFIQQFRERSLPEHVMGVLDRHGCANAPVMNASDHASNPRQAFDALWFHYDLNRGRRQPAKGFERDESLQIIESSTCVVGITLWADHRIVAQRKAERVQGTRDGAARGVAGTARRLLAMKLPDRVARFRAQQLADLPVTRDAKMFQSLYEDWFAFCRRIAFSAHWIIDTTDSEYRLKALDDSWWP